jgi:hypothetical protein
LPQVETETGEKYLVAPYSVDPHITYINEVRTVANGRDQTQTDANVRTMENKEIEATNEPEQPRTFAAPRTDMSSTSKGKINFCATRLDRSTP